MPNYIRSRLKSNLEKSGAKEDKTAIFYSKGGNNKRKKYKITRINKNKSMLAIKASKLYRMSLFNKNLQFLEKFFCQNL